MYKTISPDLAVVVQWLRLSTYTAGTQVQSLVRELNSHKPCSMVKKNNNNIKTKQNKTKQNKTKTHLIEVDGEIDNNLGNFGNE